MDSDIVPVFEHNLCWKWKHALHLPSIYYSEEKSNQYPEERVSPPPNNFIYHIRVVEVLSCC